MSLLKKMANMKAFRRDSLVRETGGIVLMLVALYCIVALFSFHAEDEAYIVTLPWYEVYSDAAKAIAATIHNPFGLFGARISVFFIRVLLGYPSAMPILGLLVMGWHLFRMKSIKPALFFLVYALLISIDLAAMFGLSTASFGDVMSGATGRMLASFLSTVIGYPGAWALTSVIGIQVAAPVASFTVPSPTRSTNVWPAAKKSSPLSASGSTDVNLKMWLPLRSSMK